MSASNIISSKRHDRYVGDSDKLKCTTLNNFVRVNAMGANVIKTAS